MLHCTDKNGGVGDQEKNPRSTRKELYSTGDIGRVKTLKCKPNIQYTVCKLTAKSS
jgi:hypothetical protein